MGSVEEEQISKFNLKSVTLPLLYMLPRPKAISGKKKLLGLTVPEVKSPL